MCETVSQQLDRVSRAFAQAYGRPPSHAAAAPGRVNLIGEHTDYNDGFVLPMAIDRRSVIVAAPRQDRRVRLRSTAFTEGSVFSLDEPVTPGGPGWSNYLRGPVALCLERGLDPGGFDALVDSTVPAGGGLSSSASLEVAAVTLVEALAGGALDPVAKALLAQRAEHEFAGTPCGIMDQFISVMGRAGHALLIDCRDHATRQVALDDPEVAVLIVNTNVKHALNGGEYAQRRRQCEDAAAALGVRALRDATLEQLDAAGGALDAVTRRRARHVITENARAVRAADALQRRDYATVGTLMSHSHASLRDDFEVSTPELDTLVRLAEARRGRGVVGSRMTGGGFGGCTVSLVHARAADEVSEHLVEAYRDATGVRATAFVTRPADGARVLPLVATA